MNDLRTLLDEYLATRRALGVRLEAAGRLLKRFVAFAGECEAPFVTAELALAWATEPNQNSECPIERVRSVATVATGTISQRSDLVITTAQPFRPASLRMRINGEILAPAGE